MKFALPLITVNFNSHAHVERDQAENAVDGQHSPHFNSHAHVERDKVSKGITAAAENFNSHAHVERDMQD